MVDLNPPEGLTDEQKRQWLLGVGTQLAEETGQRTGCADQRNEGSTQPSWVMWSLEETDPSTS